MSLNFRQFELGVLRPALRESIVPNPEVAVRLVGETIFHESDRLRALGQYPRGERIPAISPGVMVVPTEEVFGPGLGIASIERPTWDWMKGLGGISTRHYEELVYDLRLNVIACRYRYFFDPLPLPKLEDGIEARATYWWKVYNRGQVDRRLDYIANAKAIPWVQP